MKKGDMNYTMIAIIILIGLLIILILSSGRIFNLYG